MKITADSFSSGEGEDESRQVDTELKGEDMDVDMIIESEEKQVEQLTTINSSQVNLTSADNYTNGRGGGGSCRGSRGGNRMRGSSDGGGTGRATYPDADKGYQGSLPTHASSSSGHEEQQVVSGDRKEGLPKLIKHLNSSVDLKGTKRSTRFAAFVLEDIGNRKDKASKTSEERSGGNPVKMEGDAKISDFEGNNGEEDEEEFRPRKKSKENLPHWRRLRVDPPVMERIMKRIKEFSSSSVTQPQASSETIYPNACSTQAVDDDKVKEQKVGEEN